MQMTAGLKVSGIELGGHQASTRRTSDERTWSRASLYAAYAHRKWPKDTGSSSSGGCITIKYAVHSWMPFFCAVWAYITVTYTLMYGISVHESEMKQYNHRGSEMIQP